MSVKDSGKESNSQVAESVNESANPNVIYCFSTVCTSYKNGSNEAGFFLYRTLEQAKAAKNKFMYDWDPDINFGCDDSGSEESDNADEKKAFALAKKPKKALDYDEDGMSFSGSEYYCHIIEVDLTKEKPDGLIFYNRLNA